MKKNNQQDLGAFILRIGLGVMMVAHGFLKVKVFTVAGTIAFFKAVGMPLPELLAYATIFFEIVGGLFLISGILVKEISLAIIPLMLGTIIFVHGDKGWLFSNEGGGWEYPAFLAVAALAQFFLGKGCLALKFKK